jgi:hypothetical protein
VLDVALRALKPANAQPVRLDRGFHPLNVTGRLWIASAGRLKVDVCGRNLDLIGPPSLPESSWVLCSAHLARAFSQKIAAVTDCEPSVWLCGTGRLRLDP